MMKEQFDKLRNLGWQPTDCQCFDVHQCTSNSTSHGWMLRRWHNARRIFGFGRDEFSSYRVNFWIKLFAVFLLSLWGGVPPSFAAVVNCQANRPDARNVLYLYYPTATDNDFPDDPGGIGISTTPLESFDVADLDLDIGTTVQLRDAITDRVKVDYCEFDVRVVQTTSNNGTTNPTPADPRWQVVGIGSDAQTTGGGDLFGLATNVDIGDSNETDFARVWADSFNNSFGGAGEALGGANSTLPRWANAIASTASHEAGHNYGLGHGDSASQPTEDDQNNHLLATGSTGLTGGNRTEDRHFSDTGFEILAANIGLFEQTVSNWDFINPNDSTADGFRITVLVLPSAGTPSNGSVYTGGLSPWSDVSISADGTETFKGTLYNKFDIDFISPKNWNDGPNGQVPAGVNFHVGVGLTTDYIVRDTTLSSGDSELALRPRVVGYTTGGSFDASTGDFHVTFSNPDPEEGTLLLSDFVIRYIPRTVDINEMVEGGSLLGIDGLPIQPWEVLEGEGESIEVSDTADVTIGNLAEARAVNVILEADPECQRGLPRPIPIEILDAERAEIEYCPEGHVLGLFPAARIYFEATVTDPDATFFEPNSGEFVQRPLETKIFVQLPGKKPDLNENGVDDAIDISNGTCKDENNNGVCDEVEQICDPNTPGAILGTQGDDRLFGTPGDDVIIGLEGNDTLIGRGGNDCINGGAGNDNIVSGSGDDEINGGLGDDRIIAGAGANKITGGAGNDNIVSGSGDDEIDGGLGNDRIIGGPGTDTCINGEVVASCNP